MPEETAAVSVPFLSAAALTMTRKWRVFRVTPSRRVAAVPRGPPV